MLFIGQYQRHPSRSDPRWRPKDQKNREHMLRQGPMLILKSKKGGRRRGKQWRQGRRWRLILRRGKEDGPEPN